MKTAIPLAAGRLSDHFGHCEQFALVEADPASKQILKQTVVTPPPHAPGLLPRWLHQQGVNVVIAGGIGQRAQSLFAKAGITVKAGVAGGTPETLLLFKDGKVARQFVGLQTESALVAALEATK